MPLPVNESDAETMILLLNGYMNGLLNDFAREFLRQPASVDLEDEDNLAGPHIVTMASGLQLRITVEQR